MKNTKRLNDQVIFELKQEELEKVIGGSQTREKPEKTRVCPNCGRVLPAYQISCCCGW